jgi:hypothetical protein
VKITARPSNVVCGTSGRRSSRTIEVSRGPDAEVLEIGLGGLLFEEEPRRFRHQRAFTEAAETA